MTSQAASLDATTSRRRLAVEFFWLVASTGAFQASRLGTGILAAAFLAPSQYAQWGLVLAILAYSVYLNLGVASGLNRELPRLLGAQRTDEALAMEQSAIGGTMIAGLLVIPAVVLLGLTAGLDGPVVAATAAAAAVQQFYLFTQTVLRSRLRFNTASLQQAVLALAFPVVALPLLGRIGVVALVIGQLVAFAVGSLFAGDLIRRRPRFDSGALVTIVRIGFPIMVAGLAFAVLTTMDRWLVLILFGDAATGRYTLAALLSSSALLVSMVLSQQFYPRMAVALGGGVTRSRLFRMALWQSAIITGLVFPAGLVLAIAAPVAIQAWLPEYGSSAPAIQVLAIGFVALVASSGFGNFLVVLGRAHEYLATLLVAMILELGVAIGLAGLGLIGVALAAAVAYAFTLVANGLLATRALRV